MNCRRVFSDSPIAPPIVWTLGTCRWQPKETRTRPLRSGNCFGDLGQGWIVCPAVFEPIFRYRDGVRAAAPFPNKTRTGLQAETRRGANPARCPQGLGHRLQLSPGRLVEPAVLDFLKSVTEGKNQQVATDPRRFTMV